MRNTTPQAQRGAVLAVSLILLLVVTLLVLSGGRDVLMQEKMVAAQREGHASFAAVEAGLLDAEAVISGTSVSAINWAADGTGGYYAQGQGPADVFALSSSGDWHSGKYITASNNYGAAAGDTQYYFERMGAYTSGATGSNSTGAGDLSLGSYDKTVDGSGAGSSAQTLVKVVVRATGRSGNAERIVMAYYPMND